MHTLPNLPYEHNALEPYIDAQTMQIHCEKHHGAYVSNLNKALEENEELKTKSVEDLLSDLSGVPENIKTAVRNNGGGHYNHTMFWEIMTPGGANAPAGELASKISDAFGSFQEFKEAFSKAAVTRFGSGWAWLIKDSNGNLAVTSTPNQDNPLMDVSEVSGTPLLGLDVWEHAYYLKYQNRRPEYVEQWWNVVNWDKVLERYSSL